MKVALFNDTASVPHVGCFAVSDAHARMLGRMGHVVEHRCFLGWSAGVQGLSEADGVARLLADDGFRAAIEGVDALVVNGEGTIHHGSGAHLLAALGAAQQLGKATVLVNAVYEQATAYEDVVRKLDDFTVREDRSAAFARSRGIRCRVVLDSCLEAAFVWRPLVDLTGKTLVGDWNQTRETDVGSAAKRYMHERPDKTFYLPFERADAERVWRRLPSTIEASDILLTGRHHGIYFALKAHKGFVPMPSNTHKVEGFLETIGAAIPVATDLRSLEEAEAWARANPGVFIDIFARIEGAGPLTTFQALGGTFDPEGSQREVNRLQRDLDAHRDTHLMNGEWYTAELSRSYKAALQE